ncbi:MAG: GAF domain-containing protein [Myxococcales bacterium]|nr:GAF domain-containing protein [Myxococcales bacterium]
MSHPQAPVPPAMEASSSESSAETAPDRAPHDGHADARASSGGTRGSSLAAELATVHAGLAAATSEQDLLAAAMLYIGHMRPSSAHFVRLHVDADGRIERGELAAIWEHGQIQHVHTMLGRTIPLALWRLTAVWSQNPSELIAIADVQSDPRADVDLRDQLSTLGQRALVLVPLYSRAHRSWHGVLVMVFASPRELSQEEHSVCSLLADAVASFAANLHIQRSLREVFQETSLLYDVSLRLNQASSIDEALRAVAIAAPGATYAFLGILERNAAGELHQLRVVAGWGQHKEMAASVIGMTFPIEFVPMISLWIKDPDRPLLISDIETDSRVDPQARMLYRQASQRSAALLPLVVQGHVIGNVSMAWDEVRGFSARDERIFQTIAKQASLVLQNRLLVEESQAALRARAEQSALLSRVLTHLPVGVVLLDASNLRPILSNAAADALLGWGEVAPESRRLNQRFLRPGTDEPLPDEESTLMLAVARGDLQHADVDVQTAIGRRSLMSSAVPVVSEDGQLRSFLLLLTDVTERREAEMQRAKMQDELITVQAAALAERSTPIIPISDDIVVVPLIGSLDAERSNQLLDTVPEAASRYEAKLAIIDITGVSTLDTQAARTLIGVARALRLLGIEPVVTGMRAEVAQTLVQLGIRLDGMTTRSNLKSGIAYAQAVLSKRSLNRL